MEKFFKAALGIGGVATIGAAVFYGLYKEWLNLDIFGKLTSDQTFVVMLVFLVLVFLCALSFLVAYVLKGVTVNKSSARENSISIINNEK